MGDESFKARIEIINQNQIKILEKEKIIKETIHNIINDFEIEKSIKISLIDTEIMDGKRLRREWGKGSC